MKRCAVVNGTRMIDVFRRCGDALSDASEIERQRILAALAIVYEPTLNLCPPDRRVATKPRRVTAKATGER